MISKHLLGFARWIISASCACSLTVVAQNARPFEVGSDSAKDRIVVLISVDGLASYYLNDPKAHMPVLRRLAKEGAAAERMKCSMPTVTWPNHTTLVTGVEPGKHGVIANSYWDRAKGAIIPLIPDPFYDKAEIVKAPTVYDLAHQAGLKTAGIIWPATRNAATLHWQMPDVFSNSLFQAYSTPQLLEELRAGGIPVDMQETWCKTAGSGGVMRDWMYARAAAHVIRKHNRIFFCCTWSKRITSNTTRARKVPKLIGRATIRTTEFVTSWKPARKHFRAAQRFLFAPTMALSRIESRFSQT
jgi:hypothetical protein